MPVLTQEALLLPSIPRRGVPADAALERLAEALGWHSARPLPHAKRYATRAFELVAADDPLALFALSDARRPAELAMNLGYSRESPYAVVWSPRIVELHETRRWTDVPGDAPLISAEAEDREGVADLLGRLRRDDVLVDAPADLGALGEQHEPLHDSLAAVLRELRMQVAESEAYAGHEATGLDTAVLRLFHQLLYIRIAEDRRRGRSDLRIAAVINEDKPSRMLSGVIDDYRQGLNSELFDPAGIEIAELPDEPLRRVLTDLVEPWHKLRLDFSVTRTELAGRLYQSYLESLPAVTPDADSRLFPVVGSIDQRERQASYYTSPALATLIAERTLAAYCLRNRPQGPEDVRVLDPACGSGAFLVASLRWLRRYFERLHGRSLRPKEREALVRESIFGADIDERALGMTQVQLLEEADLRGKLPKLGDNLLLGDSLPSPPGDDVHEDAVDWTAVLARVGAFTSVVTNPPFGSQAKLPGRLSVEALGKVVDHYPEVREFGQDYAFSFLALSRRLLVPGGTAGFVLPRTLLDASSGRSARRFLADVGLDWIADFRAAELFPRVRRSLCALVLDPDHGDEVELVAFEDSRELPRAALDDLLDGAPGQRVAYTTLQATADDGWGPFRLRWASELSRELRAPTEPLAAPSNAQRGVHSGARPAAVDRLVFTRERWKEVHGGVEVDGRVVPGRYLPHLVYARDVQPFALLDAGRRLVYPFERDGRPTNDRKAWDLVDRVGGLPPNFRHGNVAALTGPKVLLRGLVREPASVADISGVHVPVMRGVFAIRLDDVEPRHLPGVAALLNSALYQWLLRGVGAPLPDESVELSVTNIASLPFPVLSAQLLEDLSALGAAAAEALQLEPIDRATAFAEARASLDQYVFGALRASKSLREIVLKELVRTA